MKRIDITRNEVYPDYSASDLGDLENIASDEFGVLFTEKEYQWMNRVKEEYKKLQNFLRERENTIGDLYDFPNRLLKDVLRECQNKNIDARVYESEDFSFPEEEFNPNRVSLFVEDEIVKKAYIG